MVIFTTSAGATSRLGAKIVPLLTHISARAVGRFTPIEEKVVPVRQSVKEAKLRTRCYLWGGTLSGALGRDKFVRMERVESQHMRPYRHSPSKIGFSEVHLVNDVACGHGFTIFAARHREKINKYELFGTGINSDSQLGKQCAVKDKPLELVTEPVPIPLPEFENGKPLHVLKVAAGRAHTIVVADQGSVYGLGNNSLGQCGRNINSDETYFGKDLLKRIDIPEPVSLAVCGLDHTLFLTRKGEVYACGWGADGQTGLGHYRNTGVPQKVEGDLKGVRVVKLSSRGDCVLAVSDSGDVFGWGNNEYGQLLAEKGESQRHTPKHIRFSKRINNIAAGGSSCVALDEDGLVYSWGYGILGLGPDVRHCAEPQKLPLALFGRNELSPDARVTSLVAGLNDFAAINSKGNLYTWGRNQNGSLGLGHIKTQMFPLKVNLTATVKEVTVGVDHMAVITQTFC